MIPPVYEPLSYALSGLDFTQLPVCTQQYLQQAKLVPPHVPNVNIISAERLNISMALSSSLIKNDMDLVELRLETVVMASDLETDIPSQDDLQRDALTAQESRLQKLLGDVLPERELIFNAFMIKFDALVWVDQQGREHYTPEDWQRHRDELLKPILNNTSQQLVALDSAVIDG
jgi:hypothetical protein